MSNFSVHAVGFEDARPTTTFTPNGVTLTLRRPGARQDSAALEVSAAELCDWLLCIAAQRDDVLPGERDSLDTLRSLLSLEKRDG